MTTQDPELPNGAEPAPPSAEGGTQVIARYLKTLPAAPGVYRMLGAQGEVIYVGKARSLKARVANYARLQGHTNRIARMIMATHAMEFVTVRTEAEALLLEANLIKRFKPRFNVLMRDDKSFPYILISRDHPAPQLTKHRGARTRKGDYFGPFASAGAVNRAINMLQRAFLLRTCSDSFYENRTRPCLLFQIKRCAAPCTSEIALDDYRKLTDEAVRFLRGESQSVREMYQRLMTQAADKLEFETAAKYRNRLWALAHVTADQTINPEGIEEADVFAAHQEGGQTCIQVFFFRTGQNWGNSMTISPCRASFCCRTRLRTVRCWRKPYPRKRNARWKSASPPAAPSQDSWSTRLPTHAKRWDASSPKPPHRRACWKDWPSASVFLQRPAASRSSTTAIFQAPTPLER